MAIIRAKQGVITRVLPHQGNRRYLIPGGTRGYPLGAGGITPTLDLNFAADKSLVANIGPTLTCTRASEATYFDASGVLQTAANNVARFDHDPGASNASLGLLIEEARTNQSNYSAQFDNAFWDNGSLNATHVQDQTAPDGTLTAWTVADTDASGHDALRGSIFAVTNTTNYTLSCFFKKTTSAATFPGLQITIGTTYAACVNTDTGVVTGRTTLVPDNTTSEDVGDYWRVSITGVSTSTAAPEVFLHAAVNTDGSGTYVTSTQGSCVAWGMQFEAGAFPTSYIPTTTTTVTRAADVVSTTDVSWLDGAVGSFYHQASPVWEDTGSARQVTFFIAGSGTNYIESVIDASSSRIGYADFNIRNSALNSVTTNANSYEQGVSARTAMAWDVAGDQTITVDGYNFHSVAMTSTAPTPAVFYIGSNGTNTEINSHIARIVYYDSRLTDTQLQDLSNGTFP